MRDLSAQYVDAHCHLDLFPDYGLVADRCEEDGTAVITMTTTPRAWPKNLELAGPYRLIEPALGLHPQLVAGHSSELSIWDSYLGEAHFIGEVGLDASPRFYRSFEQQKVVFEHILRKCASQGHKILSVHAVRAARTVLDLVEVTAILKSDCKVILHWFTGGPAEAKRAIDLGCHFSINAEMLRTQHHFDTIKQIPPDRILTETDGPFTMLAGRPCEPANVQAVVLALAALQRTSEEDTRATIMRNYREVAVRP